MLMKRLPLLVRLWRQSQIRTGCLVAFRILLLDDFFILDGQRNDHVIAIFPVARCRYRVTVGQLQCIQHAQHFIKVAAGAQRISNDQTNRLFRIDDDKERTVAVPD